MFRTKNAIAPLKGIRRLKGSGEMLIKFRGSISAPSRPVESPMALKAHSTNTINSNTLKSTPPYPTSKLSSLASSKSRKRLTKRKSDTTSSLIPAPKSTAFSKNWAT